MASWIASVIGLSIAASADLFIRYYSSYCIQLHSAGQFETDSMCDF
jgi:hypothetical protein